MRMEYRMYDILYARASPHGTSSSQLPPSCATYPGNFIEHTLICLYALYTVGEHRPYEIMKGVLEIRGVAMQLNRRVLSTYPTSQTCFLALQYAEMRSLVSSMYKHAAVDLKIGTQSARLSLAGQV